MTAAIDLMFHVSNSSSGDTLRELCRAAGRRDCRWNMFLTNDAVTLVKENWFEAATLSCDRVVVCEASWAQHCAELEAQNASTGHRPVEAGSQTTNSEMSGRAWRVVSL